MQQLGPSRLKKAIVENAIVLTGHDIDQHHCQSEHYAACLAAIFSPLNITIKDIELSADLLMASAKFQDELVFIHLNLITNDLWLSLASHNEKRFFWLYDVLPLDEDLPTQ